MVGYAGLPLGSVRAGTQLLKANHCQRVNCDCNFNYNFELNFQLLLLFVPQSVYEVCLCAGGCKCCGTVAAALSGCSAIRLSARLAGGHVVVV